MQWTAATGSLQPSLIYIKRRLLQTGQKRVWEKVFVAQGLDVDRLGLIVFGKPLSSDTDMRLAFRGSAVPGNYDPKVSGYWAKVMARAGRQPAIETFQREYAQQKVDEVLNLPLTGVPCALPGNRAVTVAFLTGGDPYAQALIFALWTNNPRHAQEYIADAAQAARDLSHSSNPLTWKPGVFRESLLQRCRISRFSNWKSRGELIASRASKLRSPDTDGLYPYEVTYLTEIRNQAAHAAAKKQLLRLAAQRKKNPHLADRNYSASPFHW